VKILVLNCGSSSLKFKLFEAPGYRVLARGGAERIGMPGAAFVYERPGLTPGQNAGETPGQTVLRREDALGDHRAAIGLLVSLLSERDRGVLKRIDEIGGVGHRVVHGGEYFRAAVLINPARRGLLEQCKGLAPLHNPPNLAGIDICVDLLPGVPQAAVFDTAFHQTIPDFAHTYAIPYRFYEAHRVRKYGFHGISHQYVAGRAAELLGRELASLRLITCHLGAGASLCAVAGGQSRDTSMGFTPLSGLVMGTRSGDIDPALVAFIAEKEHLSAGAVVDLLNQESGVLGLSGLSRDFRDLERAARDGHERARLALAVFAYSVARGIGSLLPAIGGLDALVFTAGVGENSPSTRSRIAAHLSWLEVGLDEDKNRRGTPESDISAAGAPLRVLIVPTDEEVMIAREKAKLLNAN